MPSCAVFNILPCPFTKNPQTNPPPHTPRRPIAFSFVRFISFGNKLSAYYYLSKWLLHSPNPLVALFFHQVNVENVAAVGSKHQLLKLQSLTSHIVTIDCSAVKRNHQVVGSGGVEQVSVLVR